MSIYTADDIHHGAGAFEQAMRSQTDLPGYAPRITPGVAVGLLSAAMRSGLPAALLDGVIDRYFFDSALMLKRVRAMYEGNDWDIHLWSPLPTGHYKLATGLCRPDWKGWRYSAATRDAD